MRESFRFEDLARYNICSNLFVHSSALSSRTIFHAKIMSIDSQFRKLEQLQFEYNEKAKLFNMLEHKYKQECAHIREKETFN